MHKTIQVSFERTVSVSRSPRRSRLVTLLQAGLLRAQLRHAAVLLMMVSIATAGLAQSRPS
jgi:hypothetical protein